MLEEKEHLALMVLPLPIKKKSVLSYMSKAANRASKMVNLKGSGLT